MGKIIFWLIVAGCFLIGALQLPQKYTPRQIETGVPMANLPFENLAGAAGGILIGIFVMAIGFSFLFGRRSIK